NTAVVICADHGEAFWERGFAAHANNLHDEEIMVPLIINTPAVNKGRVVNQQVGLIDVAPTLAALAGATPPDAWQGVDLAPLMRG
ncbi:MAG: sulfatase-like hydrolase/transferase, partial [Kiritimatiellaeota bacterium]|nr:sulfatase-like hydrolase/transferase [Kiritimatiellota bacterium]